VETIAPSIRAASAHLQTLSFTKVDLGDRVYKSVSDKSYLHAFLIFTFLIIAVQQRYFVLSTDR